MKTSQTSKTELVFILDKSGSMSGLESDTIGGYNAMLKNSNKRHIRSRRCFLMMVARCSTTGLISRALPDY